MPSWLHHDEGGFEFALRVFVQDSGQFTVRGVQCCRQDAQVDDAAAQSLKKHQAAKVLVPGNKKAVLLAGCP
ncbi:MAG: hypothetical protein Kow00123_25680 [Anaerolineales bacterium]